MMLSRQVTPIGWLLPAFDYLWLGLCLVGGNPLIFLARALC